MRCLYSRRATKICDIMKFFNINLLCRVKTCRITYKLCDMLCFNVSDARWPFFPIYSGCDFPF